jgi:hypothetical protein
MAIVVTTLLLLVIGFAIALGLVVGLCLFLDFVFRASSEPLDWKADSDCSGPVPAQEPLVSRLWGSFAAWRSRFRLRSSGSASGAPPEESLDYAYRVLGVDPAASLNDIRVAYRRLAQMYHPDKVRGLAPEQHAFANRKMAQINVVYEQVVEHLSTDQR